MCVLVLLQSHDFIVKIDEDTQDKLHAKGNARLMVEHDSIIISSLHGKRIMQWTLRNIRRFGRKDNSIFFFEAGRRSDLEGLFSFVTEQVIFNVK